MLFRITTYTQGDIPMFLGVELVDGSEEEAAARAREAVNLPGVDIAIVTAAGGEAGRVRYRTAKGEIASRASRNTKEL